MPTNSALVKIAIYGKNFDEEYSPAIQRLVDFLTDKGIHLQVFEPFCGLLSSRIKIPQGISTYLDHQGIQGAFALISIGGDGTLLDTVRIVRDSCIPILGINTGRLGFLSHVSIDEIEKALEALLDRRFQLDKRSLIHLTSPQREFSDFPYALNEVTLLNKGRNKMITIHAHIHDEYLTTYWADGLIVATPTGSTAYSLSCGGPIIMPGSNSFILTPIAAHNLNVRPLVIPDTSAITLKAESREPEFLLTLDSKTFTIDQDTIIQLARAPFELHLINFEGVHYFHTIRNKMNWGIDKRN